VSHYPYSTVEGAIALGRHEAAQIARDKALEDAQAEEREVAKRTIHWQPVVDAIRAMVPEWAHQYMDDPTQRAAGYGSSGDKITFRFDGLNVMARHYRPSGRCIFFGEHKIPVRNMIAPPKTWGANTAWDNGHGTLAMAIAASAGYLEAFDIEITEAQAQYDEAQLNKPIPPVDHLELADNRLRVHNGQHNVMMSIAHSLYDIGMSLREIAENTSGLG